MPSGKLGQGEPLPAGAARELFEEAGITVDPGHLRLVHRALAEWWRNHHAEHAVLGLLSSQENLRQPRG